MTSIVEVEPGVYSVLVDGRSYEVRVAGSDVTVGGHRLRVETEDPRQWKRGKDGAGASGKVSIVAPMPGKVVRVMVAVDEEVTAGQGLLVVEAMKMQNELKAPRAGRLTAIHVKAGDSVNAGAALAAIE